MLFKAGVPSDYQDAYGLLRAIELSPGDYVFSHWNFQRVERDLLPKEPGHASFQGPGRTRHLRRELRPRSETGKNMFGVGNAFDAWLLVSDRRDRDLSLLPKEFPASLPNWPTFRFLIRCRGGHGTRIPRRGSSSCPVRDPRCARQAGRRPPYDLAGRRRMTAPVRSQASGVRCRRMERVAPSETQCFHLMRKLLFRCPAGNCEVQDKEGRQCRPHSLTANR